MDKSPDAFRTISEVAEDLDLPQHVLRFWETRFTQIKPMKRGGGRRYYRPQDVELIKGIRHMLYEQGYTIKGVQKLLRENGNQFLVAIGSGDLQAVEAIAQRKQTEAPLTPAAQPRTDEEAARWRSQGQAEPPILRSRQGRRRRAGFRRQRQAVARQPRLAAGSLVRPSRVQTPARPGALRPTPAGTSLYRARRFRQSTRLAGKPPNRVDRSGVIKIHRDRSGV